MTHECWIVNNYARGPDDSVNAEYVGGPGDTPSRAGVCPPLAGAGKLFRQRAD